MRKLLLLLTGVVAFVVQASAQRTVSGKVTDDKGNPLANVSVVVRGTNIGTTSKVDGTYTLSVPDNAKALVFSSIDMSPVEMGIGTGMVNATLKNEDKTMKEVVVTALGIRRTERALGYAVSKVEPSNLLQKSEPDILRGLAGKVPGVDIRSGQGAPGSATRIQIRGVSSFNGGEPLIVVDGVPYSNNLVNTSNPFSGGGTYGSGFGDLDANDIESINILKGAAAASLYGSRAANGVLLITTKSGNPKKGQKSLNVTYKTGFSVETISGIPDFQNSYGAGANFRVQSSNGSWGGKFGKGVIYDAGGNIVGVSASGVDSIPATTWNSMYVAYPGLFGPISQHGTTAAGLFATLAYKAYPNNVADLFTHGNLYENSIGLNGGTGNTVYSATLSLIGQTGYITNSAYNKQNISVGGQTSVGKLTVGSSVAYSRSKQKGGFIGQAQSFLSQWGRTFTMARNWDIAGYPIQNLAGQQIGFNDGQYTNPIWAAYHNVITSIDDRIVATFRASFKFSNAFRIDYNGGVNSYALYRDQIIDKSSYGAGTPSATENPLGNLTEVVNRTQEIQSTIVAVFTPKIGSDFTLDVKLGNDINQRTGRSQSVTGVNFIIPGLYNLTNTSTQRFNGDTRSKRRLVGIFGDASLGYRNFAFINITGRMDLTSTLPYKNAQYFYPGISGSLIWTDAFKINSKILDYGKIRIGYARVGNDAAPHQEAIFNLNATGFLGQPLLTRGGASYDPNLTPEFTTEVEIGSEMRFFKRRVGLEVTYYNKKSTDLIYAIGLPVTTGYTSYFTNLGQIRNKGWEAALDVRPFNGKNFQWDVRAIYTKNENTVEELVAGLTRDVVGGFNYIEAGFPYGYLRGSHSARTEDGELLINQTSGMPFLDPNEDMVGDPNADFKIGITNTLTFKGFQLNVLWDWTEGGDFYSETIQGLLGRGVTMDTEDREKNRVIRGVYANPTPVTGADGKNHYTPLLVNGKRVQNQTRVTTNDLFFTQGTGASFATNGAFEYSVFDGTVYRLREVSLGYSFSPNLIKRLKLSAATLSLSGRNLWYLAPNVPKYTRFDPDINSVVSGNAQGVETGGAPSTRRMGVNLNITF